jgi:hypothetical protein
MTKPTGGQIMLGILVLVVGGTVFAGFQIIGNPGTAPNTGMDDQRRNDLMAISSNLDIYWSVKQKLPDTLQQMLSIREIHPSSITDPVTKQPYEYKSLGGQSYQLCATFDHALSATEVSLPPPTPGLRSNVSNLWLHDAGHVCFQNEAQQDVHYPTTPPLPPGAPPGTATSTPPRP